MKVAKMLPLKVNPFVNTYIEKNSKMHSPSNTHIMITIADLAVYSAFRPYFEMQKVKKKGNDQELIQSNPKSNQTERS